jgi:predicted nuclease of predicted toxin-antitoxin system
MRFLLDQNADRRFAPYLRDLGHDVTIVSIDYPPSIPDRTVLAIAHREGRILLTNDRDVGEFVFRHGLPHAGVIYLRLYTPDFPTKRDRLAHVLVTYATELDQFIVVTERTIRVRHILPQR